MGPDRRVGACINGRKRAGRTHVAFDESAGGVAKMPEWALNDFTAHTYRLAIQHGPRRAARGDQIGSGPHIRSMENVETIACVTFGAPGASKKLAP